MEPTARKTAYYSFTGTIDSNCANRIGAALNRAVNNRSDEAYICLSSTGGYVADAVYLYNHIRGLPIKVIAHNIGSLMSASVSVFIGAEERYCSTHSVFMVHPTTIGPWPEALAWERLDLARNAALSEDTRIENILRERTRIPDTVLSSRRMREVYIMPAQALEWGIVHGVREFALPQGAEIIQI